MKKYGNIAMAKFLENIICYTVDSLNKRVHKPDKICGHPVRPELGIKRRARVREDWLSSTVYG